MSTTVKDFIETAKRLQENEEDSPFALPCPRCGHSRMKPKAAQNALSRYANVYVCDDCGTEEAMRDCGGVPPLPLSKWSMAITFGFEEVGQ